MNDGPLLGRPIEWRVVALAVLAGGGCEIPPTQLVVVVNTDLAVPAETDEVRLRVWGPGQAEPREDRLVELDAGQAVLPASFGVAPEGRDPERRVTIAADALLGGDLVVATEAATTFVENRAMRLDLFLARACRDVSCPEGQTCRRGSCAPAEVDPDDLHGFESGEDLGPPPPDRPLGAPVLVPFAAGTELRDLDMDVAPDGAVVVVGSFRGSVTLGTPQSSEGRWAAFVARYAPDGAPVYRLLARASAADALAYAVAITADDTVSISTGCSGGDLTFTRLGEGEIVRKACLLPSVLDWSLDADGLPTAPIPWATTDALQVSVRLDALDPWVAEAIWQTGVDGFTITRRTSEEPVEQCSVPHALHPSKMRLSPTGIVWIAGWYEGTIAPLDFASLGGRDGFLVGLDPFGGACSISTLPIGGTPGDDEARGLAVEADRSAMVGTRLTADGLVLANPAPAAGFLTGPAEDGLEDVAAAAEGRWIAVGSSSAGADFSGLALDSLGDRDALVVGLDAQLAPVWYRLLGGCGHRRGAARTARPEHRRGDRARPDDGPLRSRCGARARRRRARDLRAPLRALSGERGTRELPCRVPPRHATGVITETDSEWQKIAGACRCSRPSVPRLGRLRPEPGRQAGGRA